MAPPVLRPDNALKRADELISVGEKPAALQSLYEYLTARRIRWAQPSAVEPIVFKFLEIGVDLKRGRLIKDALHQYKKLVQGSAEGLSSVSAVSRKFINLVEAKMALEQTKFEEAQQEEDGEDDLESAVTPENLLKSIYLEDQTVAGFNDDVITSWLRFTWESYRAVLDLLRNNSQLEVTYSGVVTRTMNFCLKYNRKNEFKRLAEMLRQHLDAANYQQSKSGGNIVDLTDNDTLQRYLDQRFYQVNISVKLELWHEAYRSIEDVYHLMKMSKKSPKASTLANYYENLAKVFLISNAQLLHTCAWEKFYKLSETNPNATEEDFKRYASIILLSSLSTPLDVLPRVGYDSQMRLYRLLNLEARPTRSEVIDLAKQENIFSKCDEDIKKLYEIMEVNYNVDTIQADLKALLPKLQEKPYFETYSETLKKVITRKVLVSASEKNATINMDELYKITSLPAPLDMSYWDFEKSLLQAAVEDYVLCSIDHATNTVTFANDPFEIISKASATVEEEEEEEEEEAEEEEGAEGTEEITEQVEEGENEEEEIKEAEPIVTRTTYIRKKLAELSTALNELESFKNSSYLERVKLARENLIKETKDHIENLKSVAEERSKKAQEQRQKYMANAAERAEEDAEMRHHRIMEERANIEAKMEEEARRRMIAKKKREFEELKRKAVVKFVEEVNAKGHAHLDMAEVEGLNFQEVRKLLFQKLSKDMSESEDRMNFAIQKLDHTERAYRQFELPLLAAESEKLKANDEARYEEMKSKIVEAAKIEHNAKLEDHSRLVSTFGDYQKLKSKLLAKYSAEAAEAKKQSLAKFEAAKKARIDEVRKQRYDELVAERKKEQAEKEAILRRQKQDQMAAKQREMEEAVEKKLQNNRPTATIPSLKPADDERASKFEAIARKQREMEAAAELKQQSRGAANAPATSSGAPLTMREKMRLKREAAGK